MTDAHSVLDATIVAASARNVRDTAPKADESYKREWNRFKTFVDDARANQLLPPGDKYLTRNNVDLFFTTVVALRDNVMPESARRVVSSLQYFSRFEEHPTSNFVVDASVHVANSLQAQSRRYFDYVGRQVMKEPHSNLPTNILSDNDHRKVLEAIFEGHPNWQDLALSWNCCTQTYVRGHSVRSFQFADLRLDEAHKREGGDGSRILSIVLRQGQHKHKADKTRVVGCYRHREFMQCTTGILALVLFDRLHFNRDIDFYVDEFGGSKWRNLNLISGWKDRRSHAAAYESVLRAANVSWSKVTHMRKAGMEQSSVFGDLSTDEQATMSKHKTEKVYRYVTELYAPVMKVMAGFGRTEVYSVPRAEITIPYEQPELLVFPHIHVWQAQMESPMGDKCEAARNFLNKMLPWLAEVVIQDGVYWIDRYPEHFISILLRRAMPANYEAWAKEQRNRIDREVTLRADSYVASLNGAAQRSFDRLLKLVLESRNELMAALEGQSQEIKGLAQRIGSQEKEEEGRNRRRDRGEAVGNVGACTEGRPSRTVVDLLRPRPLVPPIPSTMPLSMTQLLLEHDEFLHLGNYGLPASRQSWPNQVKMAFSRRKYLYDILTKRASQMRNTLDMQSRKRRVAAMMDEEMKSRDLANTSQYMSYLKSSDPKRNKRQRHVSSNNH